VANPFQLSVITQARTLMTGEALSVTAPGTEGYLGIWANHAPLVTALQPGKLTVKDGKGEESIYALSGGFLEVSRNVVTILADAIEEPSAIDYKRAKAAAERARKRLAGPRADVDVSRAEAALKRAILRMSMAHRKETSHPG